MLFNIPLIEWIGYIGSVVVAVSLTMSSIKKLRWYNLVGASVFSFYGFTIGALPVGFLNLFIVITDLYYLYKMYSYKESFQALVVNATDSYTQFFIQHYKTEIQEFFPLFNENCKKMQSADKQIITLVMLRDAVVAGVFMGEKDNNKLIIHLDFVTAPYRDFKPGDFVFKTNANLFKNQGIDTFICSSDNKTHQKYLLKMGFQKESNSSEFSKRI